MIKESKSSYRIAEMQAEDRPRERLAKLGAQALSTPELIAILLRVGVAGENAVQMAQRLLDQFGGLYGLRRASFVEVSRQRGMGTAKAAQLKAAIELAYRLRSVEPDDRPEIHSPDSAAELVRYEMEELVQENLWVLNVDTRNRWMATDKIYQGSLNASMVRVGELFKAPIQRSAASIILVHNHPSGDPTPSPEDVALTRAVIQAGKMLDVDVLDHLVIGRGKYVSMKERKLGFS